MDNKTIARIQAEGVDCNALRAAIQADSEREAAAYAAELRADGACERADQAEREGQNGVFRAPGFERRVLAACGLSGHTAVAALWAVNNGEL